jgi:hypothetical protein
VVPTIGFTQENQQNKGYYGFAQPQPVPCSSDQPRARRHCGLLIHPAQSSGNPGKETTAERGSEIERRLQIFNETKSCRSALFPPPPIPAESNCGCRTTAWPVRGCVTIDATGCSRRSQGRKRGTTHEFCTDRGGAQSRDGKGRPCSEIDGSSTHYNSRHIRVGSGAGALRQTRSCGRDIRGGSSR